MKLISLVINERVEKIINFDSRYEDNCNHFVIPLPVNKTLIRLNQPYMIIDGKQTPIGLEIIPNKNDSCITIKVVAQRTTRTNSTDLGKDCSGLIEDSDRHKEIKVTVEYEEASNARHPKDGTQNTKYTRTFFLHFSQYIYDVIIDFGSESSQAVWTPRHSEHKSQQKTLITRGIAKSLGQKGKIDENELKEYIQYESSDLYRSINYIRRDLKENESIATWPDYGTTNDCLIKYLVRKNELDTITSDYVQIPNTKFKMFTNIPSPILTYADGTPQPLWSFSNGKVSEVLINNIILQALTGVNNDAIKNNYVNRYAVYVHLLMPNVYPPHTVTAKLNSASKAINSLNKPTDDGKQSEWSKLGGAEVDMVSESDASLLGYYSQNGTTLRAGNYIIFDAGKGTLDFSIISANPNEKRCFISKSRSGIVGAGNAITYAILVSLVKEFLSHRCQGYSEENAEVLIREFIFSKILNMRPINNETPVGPDLSKIQTMLTEVERYKVFFNSNHDSAHLSDKPLGDSLSLGLPELDIDKFIAWINAQNPKNDSADKYLITDTDYIDAEIDNIVAEVMPNLFNMTKNIVSKNGEKKEKILIAGILFTGRGCMMKQLREKIMEAVKSLSSIELSEKFRAIVPYNNGDKAFLKHICLDISQALVTEKYDDAMGRLEISRIEKIEDNQSKSKKKEKSKTTEQEVPVFKILEPNAAVSVQRRTSHVGTCFNGVEIDLTGCNIGIGGAEYQVENGKDYTVFFDGHSYMLITQNGNTQILDGNTMTPLRSPNLYFESLFPAVTVDGVNEIVIPKRIVPPESENAPSQENDTETVTTDEDNSTDTSKEGKSLIQKISVFINNKIVKKKQ